MVTTGEAAPDFSLPDSVGQLHHLGSALSVGPVVLAFLKADCATCQLTFPYLERLHQTYRTDRWQIWGICQHPSRAADWFAQRTGVTFPLLVDAKELSVSRAFDPPATPTIFLIDGKGIIQDVSWGFQKDQLNALAGHVAAWLGKEATTIAPGDDGNPPFRPG